MPTKLERYNGVILHCLTPAVRAFFIAELANEANGGHSPSNLDSAIDSLHQGGAEVFDLTADDVVALLVLRHHLDKKTPLRTLLELRAA